MFERYTEKARRVIFFARYEASQFGSPLIETEHLLLGLLRADKALTNRFLRSQASVESIRKQIEGQTVAREKLASSVDLPLSIEGKRVLAHAAEEAERLNHKHIGTEHLLLGLLREEKCFAAEILTKRGLTLSAIREELVRAPQSSRKPSFNAGTFGKFFRDLKEAATDNELNPVVGREEELDWVIEILGSRNTKNPILVGERGTGKTAIVEALVQRIADGDVPLFLAEKRIVSFDAQLMLVGARDHQKLGDSFGTVVEQSLAAPNIIIFIDQFQTIFADSAVPSAKVVAEILHPFLLSGEIQCIGACSPDDFRKSIRVTPWIMQCFRGVDVLPLDETKTVKALYARKETYEKFHSVAYTEEALLRAVSCARRYFPDSPLVTKSEDLLDAAGSRAKLRLASLPDEIAEVQKKIKFIVHQMEHAIINHEYEKARFYSDEERKERFNLRDLRTKYNLDEFSSGVVSHGDIEDVVSRWTGIPVASIRQEHSITDKNSAQKLQVTAQEATKESALKSFLCHSSKDKPAVRELYTRLRDSHVDPWLDERNLLPGQDWDFEIEKAVRACQVVIVCLSADSVNKAGYLQKEIRAVLDVADEQPEGAIYVIPLKLEECEVPSRLRRWHWVNFFEPHGFERLMGALEERGRSLGIPTD
jgi:ATP-dependent Clp protease ATP-binding subunit ClpC